MYKNKNGNRQLGGTALRDVGRNNQEVICVVSQAGNSKIVKDDSVDANVFRLFLQPLLH